MKSARYPRIVPFASTTSSTDNSWTDEQYAYEMTMKGWVCIHVETEYSIYHEVCFYDPIRLRQDMEATVEEGTPCYAEYGALVLLPKVTVQAVEKSVEHLWEKGYFAHWRPDEKFKAPTS